MIIVRKHALILLDLQNEMVELNGKVGASGLAKAVRERNVVPNAARVLAAFRVAHQAVMHVRLGFRSDYADSLSVAPRVQRLRQDGACIVGTWGTDFPAPLTPAQDEIVITKQCVNPFFNTGLLSLLHARNVDEVVLVGVATNMAVESTARFADDAGFAVTVLEDCCAAGNAEWHRFSIENLLPLFGGVSTGDKFIGDHLS